MSGSADAQSVWTEIDVAAVRDNVATMCRVAAPAALLAVVKANAYGHGAVPVARAARAAGAEWLGVARVEEGVELREASVEGPILLLSEVSADAADAVVAHDLTTVVYTPGGIDAVAKAVAASTRSTPFPVHLKVDTGMHRVGCTPAEALALADQVLAHDELSLGGVCTHLAVADDERDPYTSEQLAAFERLVEALRERGIAPGMLHAANSAATLRCARARYDLVRVGIALYGIPPMPDVAGLRPVMSLRSRVTFVKTLPAGARVSYGLRYELGRDSRVATVPAGYADGVPRNLGLAGGEVLVRGRRHPIAGVITMDQLMVDVGSDEVEVGDEVVLLGAQGGESVTAREWSDRLGTIPYEIVTGIGARVPRRHVG